MIRCSVWLLLVLGAIGCSQDADPPADAGVEPEAALAIRGDARVSALLYKCSQEEYFGEDTSNLIPVLVGKLARGHRDPLRGAKRDLAEAGEASLKELSRLVDAQLARGADSSVLLNVLATVSLMEAPLGRAIPWRLLDHPQETIRLAALRALKGRLNKADFDRLLALVPGATSPLKSACVEPLFEADQERLLTQFEAWIEADEERTLWPTLARRLSSVIEFAPRARRLTQLLEANGGRTANETRARLSGLVARAGGNEALEFLRELLVSDVSAYQYFAVETLASSGLGGELRRALRTNADVKLRVLAASAIGKLPPEKRWVDVLTMGLSDLDDSVRGACLGHLLKQKDAGATDFALDMLGRSSADRQMALDALAEPMRANAELTAQVFDVLKPLLEAGGSVPSRTPFYQSIGQLPSAAAATYLLGRADIESGLIDGLEAHRWVSLQAGNTGSNGRAVLVEAWRAESDPVRRLDYLDALFSGRDDAVRALLGEAATRADITPFEVLVAADYLTRIGPAAECAPLLKRVALRCEEAEVRRALQCLMWRFYGS